MCQGDEWLERLAPEAQRLWGAAVGQLSTHALRGGVLSGYCRPRPQAGSGPGTPPACSLCTAWSWGAAQHSPFHFSDTELPACRKCRKQRGGESGGDWPKVVQKSGRNQISPERLQDARKQSLWLEPAVCLPCPALATLGLSYPLWASVSSLVNNKVQPGPHLSDLSLPPHFREVFGSSPAQGLGCLGNSVILGVG